MEAPVQMALKSYSVSVIEQSLKKCRNEYDSLLLQVDSTLFCEKQWGVSRHIGGCFSRDSPPFLIQSRARSMLWLKWMNKKSGRTIPPSGKSKVHMLTASDWRGTWDNKELFPPYFVFELHFGNIRIRNYGSRWPLPFPGRQHSALHHPQRCEPP